MMVLRLSQCDQRSESAQMLTLKQLAFGFVNFCPIQTLFQVHLPHPHPPSQELGVGEASGSQ